MSKKKISVVLATFNEEGNLPGCLASVRELAREIVIVDGGSTDKTVEIAKQYGARVIRTNNPPIFHVNKQKALKAARGEWVLQLDADERVTKALSEEINSVVGKGDREILARQPKNAKKARLFRNHQDLIERRDGKIGKDTGEVVAFFVPRRNYFLGQPLIHAGVYPDGVIRLVKRGKAWFPAKHVHEQIHVEGEVAWLFSDLEHHDSPTFERYLSRFNRYTSLSAGDMKRNKVSLSKFNLFFYSTVKPFVNFLNLYVRHKGFLDGMPGFIWCLFSSLHFPVAYFKYWQENYEKD